MKMKRAATLALALALAVSGAAPLVAQTSFPDIYGLFFDLFADGVDPNEGGTVFLSSLVPIGGLGEAMGGAYLAVARDNSFIEYNPAGSAVIDRTELALYHNNWIEDAKVEAAVYAMRFGDLGLAVSGKWLYLPFTEYDQYADSVTGSYYAEAIATANASIRLFPGYYFYGVAVGLNLKAAYRSFPDYDLDDDGVLEPDELSTGEDQSAFAVMADAGLLTRFNLLKFYGSRSKNASFGLTLRNIGPPAKGEALPTVASAGFAWSPLRPVTLSADVSQPLNLLDPASSERWYWSAGFLSQLTDFLGLQGGFQLKGANPRISLGAAVQIEPVTLLVNYTLDLATTFGPLNRLSLEARFDLGDRGRADRARRVEELYLSGLDAYAAGDSELAVSFWRQALDLDASFDPARESLDAAVALLDLIDLLEETRRLDVPAPEPPASETEGTP
ncbi:MAG: UPF0164 family protein [Spirochaetales bacterium]|nr:UPF0164 family protein [Spirochaetales bacterium]